MLRVYIQKTEEYSQEIVESFVVDADVGTVGAGGTAFWIQLRYFEDKKRSRRPENCLVSARFR